MMDQIYKDSNVHHLKDRQKASAFSFFASFPLLSIFFLFSVLLFCTNFFFFLNQSLFSTTFLSSWYFYLFIYLLTYLFAFSDYTFASFGTQEIHFQKSCYPMSRFHVVTQQYLSLIKFSPSLYSSHILIPYNKTYLKK